MEQHEKIMQTIMQDNRGEQNQLLDMGIWDWSQGVALYGIWKYFCITGVREYLDWLENWFERGLETGHKETINTMAPYLTLLHLYKKTEKKEYLTACVSAADWLLYQLPKTCMGGFTHVTMDSDNRQQLWADTVFMAVLFLAEMGDVCKNEDYKQEAQRQFFLHIHYLADRRSGLWCHGWSFERRDNFAGAFWARGNCWFTMAAAEVLDFLEEGWGKEWIKGAYQQQAQTLIRLQDGDGLWHTLLDYPDSYIEVSGSCGILYGLMRGVRCGYLPDSFREAVKKGAKNAVFHIGAHGIVRQVSYGTIVSEDLDYYRKVPYAPTGYGQSLMLLLLSEMQRWKQEGL